MRKIILRLTAVAALLACVLAFLTLTACEYDDGGEVDTRYYITNFTAYMTVNEDYTVDIVEVLEIKFNSPLSAYIRDIPVNGDLQVENIRAVEKDGAPLRNIKVTHEGSFLAVDLDADNYTPSTGIRKYALAYRLVLPGGLAPSDQVALNVVGHGFNSRIETVNITVLLPAQPQEYSVYSGKRGQTSDSRTVTTVTENTVNITLKEGTRLNAFEGITLGLNLPANTFTARADGFGMVVIITAAIAVVLLYLLYAAKKNKQQIFPVVNFTPPRDLDPAQMGHLIDGVCSPEDITALVYYWANCGYLAIEITQRAQDTTLYKLRELPKNAPFHQKVVFERLFFKRDSVKLSSLTNNFYQAVTSASSSVRAQYSGKLYNTGSFVTAALFAALSALFVFICGAIYGLRVSTKFFNFAGLIAFVPAALSVAGAIVVFMFKPKQFNKRTNENLYLAAVVALSALSVPVYKYAVLLSWTAAVGCAVICLAAGIMLPGLLKRKDYYTDTLNDIIGFKNFLEFAEKDRLETLLAENPNYYYDILPYANVLGVSDIWMDKFKSLTVRSPYWMRSPTVFDLVVFNAMFRRTFSSMTTTFTSRPAQSGKSGFGGFGGGGGGFSGGGFGGGGGRAR